MAAITDAMQWSGSPGEQLVRPKYLFDVIFYTSTNTDLQSKAKLAVRTIRTIELPKFSIETEVVNAWNVRQLVPTRINYEPISITFNDTTDNSFQQFIKTYMGEISTNFDADQIKKSMSPLRKAFDGFGLKVRPTIGDTVIDKIEIIKFYGSKQSTFTLWRPKIIDIQHDTLDYSASEAVTWTISLRYEAVSIEEEKVAPETSGVRKPAAGTTSTTAGDTSADDSGPGPEQQPVSVPVNETTEEEIPSGTTTDETTTVEVPAEAAAEVPPAPVAEAAVAPQSKAEENKAVAESDNKTKVDETSTQLQSTKDAADTKWTAARSELNSADRRVEMLKADAKLDPGSVSPEVMAKAEARQAAARTSQLETKIAFREASNAHTTYTGGDPSTIYSAEQLHK
jgi:hypothetical protein